jgi:ribokinase
MAKIVVAGSINNDLIINSPKPPYMGETVIGGGFMTAAGGKGANQAVAAARLGAEAVMLGAVGNDLFGAELKANLERNKVNTNFVKICEKYPTGTAVIVLHKGDNFIVVDPGANQSNSPEDIKNAEDMIKQADMLMVQLEIPFETVRFVMETAKKYNVKVLLNPAPAAKIPDSILTLADILTPNESECEALSGISAKSVEGAFEALRYFMSKGIKQVCITMGENGAAYNINDELRHIPCRNVSNVEDTTAAGDSFSAALAVALCEGKNIEEAVGFATAVASLTVTKKGAQPSLPYRKDVDAL